MAHVTRFLVGVLVAAALPLVGYADDRTWEQLEPELNRLYQEERFTELAAMADEAVRAAEQTFGPNDPKVATLITTLSHAYRTLAMQAMTTYGGTEAHLQRAIRIFEKARGPDHPDVAAALNNLGELYSMQANYREAEPLFKRALSIWERANGADDPHVAVALNNLAWLYKVEGRYAEAESLYRRALSIFKSARMTRHPTYAVLSNNLNALVKARAKQTTDPSHPTPQTRETAASPLHTVAIREAAGPEEAAYQRKLAALEETLGPDHPNVADVLKDLAGLYAAQGRSTEAEALYQRALAIDEHSTTDEAQKKVLSTLNHLIELCNAQHRDRDALPLYERLLALLESRVGPKHADLIPVLEGYAQRLEAVGNAQGADAARARADRIRQKPER